MAAAVPILKFAGIALSVKSAYEGLKEGNLFQAVAGAFGAYYGIQSLSSGAAGITDQAASELAQGSAQTTATAGANTADKLGSEIVQGWADKTSGAALGSEAAKAGLESAVPETVTSYLAEPGVQEAVNLAGKEATKVAGQEATKQTGLIGKSLQFIKDNPEVTQAGLGLVGGYMQGAAEEELLKREEKLMKQRRKRMGTPGNVGPVTSIQWNPETKRFEMR